MNIEKGDWVKYNDGDQVCIGEVESFCDPIRDGKLFYHLLDKHYVFPENIISVRKPNKETP